MSIIINLFNRRPFKERKLNVELRKAAAMEKIAKHQSENAGLRASVEQFEKEHMDKSKWVIIHNVKDRRSLRVGSWRIEPLNVSTLTINDVGRTVIYKGLNGAEAGTLTSWKGDVIFARYSIGLTAAGAKASDIVFGVEEVSP
jgi:hypothetical protein